MMNQHTQPPIIPQRGLSTDELANMLNLQPGSLRVRLCKTGSYFGLVPTKLPNGRLQWPADAVQQLTGGQK